MTPAEVLNRAADRILEHGHCKGDYGDDHRNPDTCRVCLYGALNAATTGDPFTQGRRLWESAEYLVESVVYEGEQVGDLADWNDDPDRAADEVIAVLREAAELVTA